MRPGEWLLDETSAWVRRVESDLRAADLCAADVPAESLFHCQQAAEKYRKDFLAWNQIAFRKTHELRDLGEACVRIDATPGAEIEAAYVLSKYARGFRYPGAPYEPDSGEAAEEGRAQAESVRAAITKRLPEAAKRA